jgi:copper(I)-binding protein
MIMRLTTLALVALLAACAPDDAAPPASPAPVAGVPAGSLVVSEAWVRQVPPAARMTAGYLKLRNTGTEPAVIVGAESPMFNAVEIHGTVTVDGMARMRQQESVTVPPGETVSFEPGGLHLMLMQAVDGIPGAGEVPLSLLLADGARIEVTAPIGQPAD